jgi:hypothetical protein
MRDTTLLADLGPIGLFGLAAIIFGVGWRQTGNGLFAIAALILVLATAYSFYRVRSLYIR